jgi:hypothetical protein
MRLMTLAVASSSGLVESLQVLWEINRAFYDSLMGHQMSESGSSTPLSPPIKPSLSLSSFDLIWQTV